MENDASPDKKLAALANSYQIFFIVKNYEKRAERCREANETFNIAPKSLFVSSERLILSLKKSDPPDKPN